MLSETAAMDGRAADCGGLASASPVITCEHGGNRIPVPYRDLFHTHHALLDSHRGYDSGALMMARALATAFAAPLVGSTVSRLLVDLNRSIGHPRLHSEATRKAPVEVRQQILKHYYQSYRAQAERFVRQAIADHGRVIHLSSHSFTPELDGKARDADIGLLYDPARPGEADLCERWKASLEDCAPDLTVRRNYPYAGKNDGLTAWFRRRLPPGACGHRAGGQPKEHCQGRSTLDRHAQGDRRIALQGAREPLCGDFRPYNQDRQSMLRGALAVSRTTTMKIRIGYELIYDCPQPTPMILTLSVHYTRVSDIIIPDHLIADPPVPLTAYRDSFGNWCSRIVAPKGLVRLSTDALVKDTGQPDLVVSAARQTPVEELPDETLLFLLGSRYCETDRLSETAWQLFGKSPTGWGRVQAICDHVHRHITFGYEHARFTKTAWETFHERTGVCRDYAHLAIAFCRCMNIPARYCTGYLGDIGVPPPYGYWYQLFCLCGWGGVKRRSLRDDTAKSGRVGASRRAYEYHALGWTRIFSSRFWL
jgi:predicted N-formylglutamate amidohydrolase